MDSDPPIKNIVRGKSFDIKNGYILVIFDDNETWFNHICDVVQRSSTVTRVIDTLYNQNFLDQSFPRPSAYIKRLTNGIISLEITGTIYDGVKVVIKGQTL